MYQYFLRALYALARNFRGTRPEVIRSATFPPRRSRRVTLVSTKRQFFNDVDNLRKYSGNKSRWCRSTWCFFQLPSRAARRDWRISFPAWFFFLTATSSTLEFNERIRQQCFSFIKWLIWNEIQENAQWNRNFLYTSTHSSFYFSPNEAIDRRSFLYHFYFQ